MIKINLLPQRRVRKSDAAQQQLGIGFGVIVAAAAAVFLLVHRPLQAEVADLTAANDKMKKKINERKKSVANLPKLQRAFEDAQTAQEAIARLDAARATPAWLLHELSTILTKDKSPTMTKEMADRVQNDPNRGWTQGWDPKHVWINSFEERKGTFTLKGGAQSDSDMTQLSLRLQASMYFDNVVPLSGGEKKEGRGGVSYYDFIITGTVVY